MYILIPKDSIIYNKENTKMITLKDMEFDVKYDEEFNVYEVEENDLTMYLSSDTIEELKKEICIDLIASYVIYTGEGKFTEKARQYGNILKEYIELVRE